MDGFSGGFSEVPRGPVVLYHGSRGGLLGEISPRCRPVADLGQGFYMAADSLQSKVLVAGDPAPVAYALRADLSKVPRGRVLVLGPSLEWAFAVLHGRRCGADFCGSALDGRAALAIAGADFVVAPAADGPAGAAIELFAENGLTDEGLMACLGRLPLGTQVVARTQAACGLVEVVSEQRVYAEEADAVLGYARARAADARRVVREAAAEFSGRGRVLSRIVEEAEEDAAGARECIGAAAEGGASHASEQVARMAREADWRESRQAPPGPPPMPAPGSGSV